VEASRLLLLPSLLETGDIDADEEMYLDVRHRQVNKISSLASSSVACYSGGGAAQFPSERRRAGTN
jgi:hypothetical protein